MMGQIRRVECVVYLKSKAAKDLRIGEVMELHPKILEKNGNKELVILPYEEFEGIEDALSDYEDLWDLREAKQDEQNQTTALLGT
jgi:hypothetical protein